MPSIYDNKNNLFLSGLSDALERSHRSDICVAYFNLRGWKKVAQFIDKYDGEKNNQCRLLLGMYTTGYEFERELLQEKLSKIDREKAKKLRNETIKNFRDQLMKGIPSNKDEEGLRRLVSQLKNKKVVVKCFTRHPLHAKLYLTFNNKEFAKKVGFLGSSNLTYAGLEKNGELNIDVLDQQSCEALCEWFDEKWQDHFSLDISEDIIRLIEESWAGEKLLYPYHIYMKMAYHLSEDARKGLTDFFIPKELQKILFDFQSAAVRIATRYVYNKNGVLLGDVVGLGKTLMAIAVAKILEEEHNYQSLILCPKNLEKMWDNHAQKYHIRGRVIPISQAQNKLPELQRHQVVIIDESHALRNPRGKRYQVIKDYIVKNDSKCILLSATPYNKIYTDLSSQLGLFIDPDADLGVRPNRFLRESQGSFQGLNSSLKAFEQSNYSEDWQQLMSQFLIRRTRSFIKKNYGNKDSSGRFYLKGSKGDKKFFPERIANTIKYKIHDQYKRFFSKEVVDMINDLKLSRYGLYEYKKPNLTNLTKEEEEIFKDLKQSRTHPRGFCRIGLFKRLESSGFAFLQSVQRHILRNCIFIYAINNKKDLMIKEKNSEIIANAFDNDEEGGITGYADEIKEDTYFLTDFQLFYNKAENIYKKYKERNSKGMRWISSTYFTDQLKQDLKEDTNRLINLLETSKEWKPDKDLKIETLEKLLKNELKGKKKLIFTQFKETAEYINRELQGRNLKGVELITGQTNNIQDVVNRFSPRSNDIEQPQDPEIDILVTTDVLSEGQNLQDCNIVVNYDLPWAIIKLIQRVGRIDRIGQRSNSILCYSFMPDEGLEEQIKLRDRIQNRLKENAEVIGTDEQFFKNDKQILINLYNEKSETLEKEISDDIDLASYALEIWNKGIAEDPSLENKIKNMPNVVHASKRSEGSQVSDEVLLFAKSHINNYLLCLDKEGNSITEDQMAILKKAACQPSTAPLHRTETHYEIVKSGLNIIAHNLKQLYSQSGSFGTGRNPRKKLFEKLDNISDKDEEIKQIIEDIYHYPLSNEAEQTLKRMFRRKSTDKDVLALVIERHKNETLVNKKESKKMDERPSIVCSMGILKK